MGKVRLSLSVSDESVKDIESIARAAQNAGMKIEHKLESLGVLTGEIAAEELPALGRIPGVVSVEEERQVGTLSPGAAAE